MSPRKLSYYHAIKTLLLCTLVLSATLVLSPESIAETLEYRVAYVGVSASDQIRAGELQVAIGMLGSQTSQENIEDVADELATLCALYIVTGAIENARTACDSAVRAGKTSAEHNNRGVLLAHLGDTEGALIDFEKVRILDTHRQQYITELVAGDSRLMASNNFEIAAEYMARRDAGRTDTAVALTGASVEDLSQ